MKNIETILWAVKIGDEDWKEQIITNDRDRIEDAKRWASENGFDRFRISTLNLGIAPDFAGTLRKKGATT